MKAKKLGLRDALKLASILDKYVDVDKSEKDVVDFISDIVNIIEPSEYLLCVKLLTGMSDAQLSQLVSIEILTEFIEGLKENKIIALVSFYRNLGFEHASADRN